MTKRMEREHGVYRVSRAVFPTDFRARAILCALLAGAAPLAGLAAALGLTGAPALLSAILFGAAALGLALGLLALRALLAPIETLGAALGAASAARGDDRRDAIGRIAAGAAALEAQAAAAAAPPEDARLDDPLTGLPNRVAAMRRGRDEITRARRRGDALSVALIAFRGEAEEAAEIGPERRDFAIRSAAEATAQGLRAYDVVARWDGAAFVALLPEAEVEHAVAALERIAETLGPPLRKRGYGSGFDLLAGVAVLQPEDATLADIVRRAEGALDRARSGLGPAIAAAPGPRSRPANLSSV